MVCVAFRLFIILVILSRYYYTDFDIIWTRETGRCVDNPRNLTTNMHFRTQTENNNALYNISSYCIAFIIPATDFLLLVDGTGIGIRRISLNYWETEKLIYRASILPVMYFVPNVNAFRSKYCCNSNFFIKVQRRDCICLINSNIIISNIIIGIVQYHI